jgi:tetratricopeptide (TPR) repeat protein
MLRFGLYPLLVFRARENRWSLPQEEEEYRKAIELKPSYSFVRVWYCQLLYFEQRWEEAREQIEKAMELDPLSPVVILNLGNLYFHKREYQRALELYKSSAELDPAYYFCHSGMFWAYGRMKMFDEMRKEGEICVRLVKDTYPHMQAWVDYYSALCEDDKEKAKRMLPQLLTYDKDPGWSPYTIAVGYFLLGEKDRGFELLKLTYSKWKEALLNMKNDFAFDRVRNDPRYIDLLKRLGLD